MSFRPFNLTADSSCRERVPTAFQMAALIGLGASTNDASRTAMCGSDAEPKAGEKSSVRIGGRADVLIIAALLAFASGICQAQEPSAGPLIDRWEAKADRIEQRLTDHNREFGRMNAIGERFEKFADRISTFIWLAFWLLIVAMVSVTVASAAYGLDKVAGVVKSVGEAVKAWGGKP